MIRRFKSIRFLLLLVIAIATGCTTSQKFGSYRVDAVKDGMFNLVCFPHLELYFQDKSSGETTLLGACGAPGIVTSDFKLPVVPSCYAVNQNTDSVIYYHNSMQCGGGGKSEEKASGVYLHTAGGGIN